MVYHYIILSEHWKHWYDRILNKFLNCENNIFLVLVYLELKFNYAWESGPRYDHSNQNKWVVNHIGLTSTRQLLHTFVTGLLKYGVNVDSFRSEVPPSKPNFVYEIVRNRDFRRLKHVKSTQIYSDHENYAKLIGCVVGFLFYGRPSSPN